MDYVIFAAIIYIFLISPFREGMGIRKLDPEGKAWPVIRAGSKSTALLSAGIGEWAIFIFCIFGYLVSGIILAVMMVMSAPLFILGYLAPVSWRKRWFI